MKTKKAQRCKEEDLEAGKELVTEFPDAQLDNDGNIIHGVKEEKEYPHKKIMRSELIKEIAKQTNHKYTAAQISAAIEKSQVEDNAKINEELEEHLDKISGLEKGSTKKAMDWAEQSGFNNDFVEWQKHLKILGWVLVRLDDYENQLRFSDAAMVCHNLHKLKISSRAFALLCYLSDILPIKYSSFHKTTNDALGVSYTENKKPSFTKDIPPDNYLPSSWTKVSKQIQTDRKNEKRKEFIRVMELISNNSRDLIESLRQLRKNGLIDTFKGEAHRKCRPTEYLCINADVTASSFVGMVERDENDQCYIPEETAFVISRFKTDQERREKLTALLLMAHSFFL